MGDAQRRHHERRHGTGSPAIGSRCGGARGVLGPGSARAAVARRGRRLSPIEASLRRARRSRAVRPLRSGALRDGEAPTPTPSSPAARVVVRGRSAAARRCFCEYAARRRCARQMSDGQRQMDVTKECPRGACAALWVREAGVWRWQGPPRRSRCRHVEPIELVRSSRGRVLLLRPRGWLAAARGLFASAARS